MKRLLAVATAGAVAVVFAASAGATYGGPELAAGKCDGNLVLNVHHGVVNDVDSGQAGNYWAEDNYNRHIRLWQTGPGAYCAIVVYEGTFTTFVGEATPGATGVFTSSFTGRFDGGYRASISGTFSPGSNPTRGQLGTKDYGCDQTGTCSGLFGWVGTYFPGGAGFTYDWWGWSYSAPGHGTWINDTNANSGDITP